MGWGGALVDLLSRSRDRQRASLDTADDGINAATIMRLFILVGTDIASDLDMCARIQETTRWLRVVGLPGIGRLPPIFAQQRDFDDG